MYADITTSEQIRKLMDSEHDRYKSEWQKHDVVQFKNENIAILEFKNDKKVQFIVALDQLTKEGYTFAGGGANVQTFKNNLSTHLFYQRIKQS